MRSRSEWGARSPKGTTSLHPNHVQYITIHWPGSSSAHLPVEDIAAQLRGWQNYHMDVRGWRDIAYNEAVDLNGENWELRGLNVQDGSVANMGGLVYSILAVYGQEDVPTEAMKRTIKERVEEAKKRFPNAKVVGHRELKSTECPGDAIFSWLKAGMPTEETAPEPMRFRYMELNCLSTRFDSQNPLPNWPTRDDRIVRLMRLADADAYGLIEASETQRNYIRAHLPGGTSRWKVWTRGDNYDQAILFDSEKLKHFGPDPKIEVVFGPTNYHGGLYQLFEAGGIKFWLGVFHLPPLKVATPNEQREHFEKFLAKMPEGTVLIAGDGNNESLAEWAPSLLNARTAAKNSKTRDVPTSGKRIIDYVLTTKDVEIRGYTVSQTLHEETDHEGVIVAVTIFDGN